MSSSSSSSSAGGASASASAGAALPAGTIKRLMITKLVMENFKSYGGRKEIGPFHKVWLLVDATDT